VGQLKSAEKYMLGKELSQIKNGVVKTAPDLYMALGCDRDNFSNNVLVTRKLNGKSYSKMKENNILAHKMSISFSPEDNHKLNYRMAYEIANQFAEKFMHEKGHEVLFAVHTDSKHIHVHFLISNCNMNTGKSYRRNKKDLWDMSEFFGKQCLENGLENSVRDEFYKKDLERQRDKITFAERKMTERGAETFKEELREVIKEEIQNPKNKNFDDFVKALWDNWNIETRVAGNTISYRHPEYKDKNNNLVSVRGSKLGDMYTVKGVSHELNKKTAERVTESGRGNQNHTHADGTTRRTAEPETMGVYSERGTGQNLETNTFIPRAEHTGLREQKPSDPVVYNDESDLRSLDSFYDRYRKPVKEDERATVEPVTVAKKVRSRGAR
jgi:hypothetical protein